MKNENYVEQSSEVYDALVIGSGITGGWAAKEFTERGFKTLMIERGRLVEHRKDYTTEARPPWQYKNRTKVAFDLVDDQYKIQRQ